MARTSLSVYLIRDWVKDPESALEEIDEDFLRRTTIGGSQCLVAVRRKPNPDPIPWVEYLSSVTDGLLAGVVASPVGCVLIVEVEGRFFALSFGTGRFLLKPHAIERDFGVIVAANAVSPDSLGVVETLTVDLTAINQKSQVAKRSPLTTFNIDHDRGAIRGISGRVRAEIDIATSITGRDAVRFANDVPLDELPELMTKLKNLYESEDYKQTSLATLDHFQIMSDQSVIDELDENLIQHVVNGNVDGLMLWPPDMMDCDTPIYRYRKPKRGSKSEELDLELYIRDALDDGESINLDAFHKHQIFCIDSESDELIGKWPVYRCLYWETHYKGHDYVLVNGGWRRLSQDFIDSLNAAVSTIPSCDLALASSLTPDPTLTERKDKGENQYIAEQGCDGNALGLKVLHRATVPYGGGHGSIEFCDLISPDRHLIHAKRGCSGFGYLGEQAVNSASLMLSEMGFRVKVDEKLSSANSPVRLEPCDNRPNPAEWEIVLVMIETVKKPRTNSGLPIAARMSLRSAATRLRAMNFRVSTHYVRELEPSGAST